MTLTLSITKFIQLLRIKQDRDPKGVQAQTLESQNRLIKKHSMQIWLLRNILRKNTAKHMTRAELHSIKLNSMKNVKKAFKT